MAHDNHIRLKTNLHMWLLSVVTLLKAALRNGSRDKNNMVLYKRVNLYKVTDINVHKYIISIPQVDHAQ